MLSEEITGVCGENSGGFHRILQILSVEIFIEKEMVQRMLATELECTEKTMEWDWVRPSPMFGNFPHIIPFFVCGASFLLLYILYIIYCIQA